MPTDGPQMIRALNHPTRREILRTLLAGEGQTLSASEVAENSAVPLSSAAHHMRELSKAKAIRLVKTVPRRGAVEHFYRADLRESREWVPAALEDCRAADTRRQSA